MVVMGRMPGMMAHWREAMCKCPSSAGFGPLPLVKFSQALTLITTQWTPNPGCGGPCNYTRARCRHSSVEVTLETIDGSIVPVQYRALWIGDSATPNSLGLDHVKTVGSSSGWARSGRKWTSFSPDPLGLARSLTSVGIWDLTARSRGRNHLLSPLPSSPPLPSNEESGRGTLS